MLEAWGNQGTVVGGEWFWSDTREVAAGIPRLSLPGHCWRLAATHDSVNLEASGSNPALCSLGHFPLPRQTCFLF